jgi:hypothetical protein
MSGEHNRAESAHAMKSFLGGLRSQSGFALWPLVRLSLSGQGVRVAPSIDALARFVPTLTIELDTIDRAERISGVGIVPSPGVRILFKEAKTPIIFWTLSPRRVLDALEAQGVAVDRTRHRAPFWGT